MLALLVEIIINFANFSSKNNVIDRDIAMCLYDFTCVGLYVSCHRFGQVFILLEIVMIYAHRWTAEYSHIRWLSQISRSGDLPPKQIFSVTKTHRKPKCFSHFISIYAKLQYDTRENMEVITSLPMGKMMWFQIWG